MKNASFYDRNGKVQEVTDLSASIYKEAHDLNISVGQLLERRYETDAEKYGSVLAQFAASTGLMTSADKRFGLRTPFVGDVLNGNFSGGNIDAAVITKDSNPASRIIFPAVILEVIENQLAKDYTTQPEIFDKLVAIDETLAGARFDQPVLDFTKPAGARSQGQAQGALPSVMGVLSVSEISRRIPTFALGLEVTDEALKATTLDFLTLSLRRQVQVERDARVEGYISAMVSGDADLAMAANPNVVTTIALDAACPAGKISQNAWVLWLFRNFRKRQISHVICDINTALLIENRVGKPVITSDDPNSPRINAQAQLLNYILSNVKMFIVSPGVVPANTVIGIDARYAIRRVRNSQAAYQASEQFVMRRVSQLRFDFGEIVHRMFDDAWDQLTIS